MHPKDLACLGLDFGAVLSGIHQGQRLGRFRAKDDGHIVEFDGVCGVGHLIAHFRVTRSIRSSMMATTTMISPDSKPSPVFT